MTLDWETALMELCFLAKELDGEKTDEWKQKHLKDIQEIFNKLSNLELNTKGFLDEYVEDYVKWVRKKDLN